MPIRILHAIAGMGSGGAEMMIMNWYRNIDRSKIQFDFLLRSKENIYADEITALGGRVYYTAEYPRHYFKNLVQTYRFFEEHASEYTAIHVHCNALLYVNIFDIAKKFGIRTRIIHSHSTKAKNKVYGVVHKLNRGRVGRVATHFAACSHEAAKWAFKENTEYGIVTNGIDARKFQFNEKSRSEIRAELGIENAFVIGHVGRFLDVKNHSFLVDVFERVAKENSEAHLVLVGEGPLEEEIKKLVVDKGLTERVHFLGVRKDVHKIYSAFDCFILPSKYEGLGIVLVEAQASGLKCLTSDQVPRAVKSTELVNFLAINDSTEWANAVFPTHPSERLDFWRKVDESGFSISASVEQLQKYYLTEE